MRLLNAGVDTSVITLWMGHENSATTQVYIHDDLVLKERAIARTAPQDATPGRYQPPTICSRPRRAVIMPNIAAHQRGPPPAPARMVGITARPA
jgi:hypothetical protein